VAVKRAKYSAAQAPLVYLFCYLACSVMLFGMLCERAIVYFRNGKADSYCLIAKGTDRPGHAQGENAKEVAFKEAYALFPAVRKNWNLDGTTRS
jgi:hypothetical protein